MMLRGSPRLKEYEPDGWSNATQIICHDAETRIKSLQAKIDKLNAEIAELETKPANEMIEEYEGYSRKVWQIISQKHGTAKQVQREIDHINLYVKRGKELIWCIVAYDDPVGKEFKELEEQGMIEYPKNWI
jgi:predicted RNase H-like nuclease (RuvC/YqgF family)